MLSLPHKCFEYMLIPIDARSYDQVYRHNAGGTECDTAQGQSSSWHDFVKSLPDTTNSPVLWSPEEQSDLLQGSPALKEAQARAQALNVEWDSLSQQIQADQAQKSDSERLSHHISTTLFLCAYEHVVYNVACGMLVCKHA